MMVNPVASAYRPVNPPRQKRCLMAINNEKHTVIDSMTGKRFTLPPAAAWDLYETLNQMETINEKRLIDEYA